MQQGFAEELWLRATNLLQAISAPRSAEIFIRFDVTLMIRTTIDRGSRLLMAITDPASSLNFIPLRKRLGK